MQSITSSLCRLAVRPRSVIVHQATMATAVSPSYVQAIDLPDEICLNNLAPLPGAVKQRMRVGRGPGSGKGKTCGRGHKGQRARSGGGSGPRVGFEGGQTPIYRAVPKRGFTNAKFKRDMVPVSVGKLQQFIDMGRLDPNRVITLKELRDSGIVGPRVKHGIKLLARDAESFSSKVEIEVSQASTKAIEAIEAAGGGIRTVYHNELSLRAVLKPESFEKKGRPLPRQARPTPKLMKYYTNFEKRGYLSPEMQALEVVEQEEAQSQ